MVLGSVKISIDMKKVQKQLSDLSEHGIKDAMKFALNITAARCKTAVVASMEDVFDRPTPFTLRAFRVEQATTKNLVASVEAKDLAAKGTAAGEYLKPQIFGGGRPLKRFEQLLAPWSGGQYVVPGPGAQLDSYGNISRGQIVQILSRLRSMSDTSQNVASKTLNRLKKQKKNARGSLTEYFIARDKGNGRPRGIFKLVGRGHVVPVLWFTQGKPTYGVRLKFDEIVQETANREIPLALNSAIKGAIKRGYKA